MIRKIAPVLLLALIAACSSTTHHAVSVPHTTTAAPAASTSPATPKHRHQPRHQPRHHPRHHHSAQITTACGTELWAHIYHPDRLQIIHRCLTVHGRVTETRWEPDGDLHIDLAVNLALALTNEANNTYQHGDLLLEEICQGSVTQADAIEACQGVPHNLTIPAVGDKITVSGSYVLDTSHGWMEIHPVTSLTVTGTAPMAPPPPPPSSAAPPSGSSGCHPTTSSGNCYEPGEFCPEADAGMTGVAGDGKTIVCQLESGRYHWH